MFMINGYAKLLIGKPLSISIGFINKALTSEKLTEQTTSKW